MSFKSALLLVTKLVLSVIVISLTLTGCGVGGGNNGNSGFNPNNPTPASIAMDGSGTLTPYQVASAKVSNASLSLANYPAKIDQTPVTLIRHSTDTLSLVMPDLPTGQHTLSLQIEGQTVSVKFDVIARASISNPSVYVSDLVTSLTTSLDTQIATLIGVAGEEGTLLQLQQIRNNISTQSANIASLSDSDKIALANFLNTNFVVPLCCPSHPPTLLQALTL
jgi:hypothetical protein